MNDDEGWTHKKFSDKSQNKHTLQKCSHIKNIKENFLSSIIPPRKQHCTITKGDSVAWNHYFVSREENILTNITNNYPTTVTILPNNASIEATT